MQLDIELKELNDLTLKMCEVVLSNIKTAVNSFIKQEVTEIDDDIVDSYERDIEEKCLDILVKERIYASDLKMVTGILKLVSDLERIADHAVDITTFNKKLLKREFKLDDQTLGMVNLSLEMTSDSIQSFINKDVELAKTTICKDDIVDKMYKDILKSIINDNNQEENYVSIAIYKTLVVKYVERISDHAVNIAEWVIYIASGFYKDKQIY